MQQAAVSTAQSSAQHNHSISTGRRTHQRWRSRRRLVQPNSFIISDIVANGEDEHSHAQQCRGLLF